MAATNTATGPNPIAIAEMPGTSLSRSALLAGALLVGSALGGSSSPPGLIDQGTRLGRYIDVGSLVSSTSLQRVQLEGAFEPIVRWPTMAQINALAPLSLREWGRVFGVSHTSISGWLKEEPADRAKLGSILAALEGARHKPRLEEWLLSPVRGSDLRPIDLLRDERWRAFRGALSARPAPPPALAPAELEARRRSETSWGVPEMDIEPDDEA